MILQLVIFIIHKKIQTLCCMITRIVLSRCSACPLNVWQWIHIENQCALLAYVHAYDRVCSLMLLHLWTYVCLQKWYSDECLHSPPIHEFFVTHIWYLLVLALMYIYSFCVWTLLRMYWIALERILAYVFTLFNNYICFESLSTNVELNTAWVVYVYTGYLSCIILLRNVFFVIRGFIRW